MKSALHYEKIGNRHNLGRDPWHMGVAGDPDAEARVTFPEREIETHQEHGGEYGYRFFV